MKKLFIILSAAALVASCNLNQITPSNISADDYIKDDASLNNVVNGVYNGMYSVLYDEWAVTELRTDNVRIRVSGSTAADTKLIEELDQATISTSNEYVEKYWNACYKTINRANTVLANLSVCKSEENRKQFEGEALFLRSYIYFNLVRLWGPVFIVLKKTGADEARVMQRSTVEEVYDLIEGDLGKIIKEGLLPVRMPEALRGRAELDAAKLLLAKVYMTRYKAGTEQYAKARTLLSEIVTDRYKGTLVPYADVFATNNEMNAEIIFAIRYKSGNLGIGAPFSSLHGPINNANSVCVGSPKHYDFPSDNLIAAFEKGDLRKDVTLRESYINITTQAVVDGANGRFCNKFMDYGQITAFDAETDWPAMRLADAMLLLAEAQNEIDGPSAEALQYVNAIRERAGLSQLTLAELSSRYDFREAVRKERRVELAMEDVRWFDLLRWGTAQATVNNFLATEALYGTYGYVVNPIDEWQLLLPIPTSVRDINNAVAQNPGY